MSYLYMRLSVSRSFVDGYLYYAFVPVCEYRLFQFRSIQEASTLTNLSTL